MNRPYRCAATIHPVRHFSRRFSSSNIRWFISGSQERDRYLTGQGCRVTPQMDFYETINFNTPGLAQGDRERDDPQSAKK